MTRTVHGWSVVLALLVAVPAWAQSDDEEELSGGESAAETEKGAPATRTLAERVPAVTRRAFRKAGRVEFFPALGLSLNDPFYNHYITSAGFTYHIMESLAVSASGDFYASQGTALQVTTLIGVPPSRPDYDGPAFGGRLELVWAPLYGKLSLFAEKVLHFDTYLSVGGGIIGPKRGDPAVAGTFAIGQHYFLNPWMAVRLDLRDQVYSLARNPEVSGDKKVQNLLSFTVGMCFYVPSELERETL